MIWPIAGEIKHPDPARGVAPNAFCALPEGGDGAVARVQEFDGEMLGHCVAARPGGEVACGGVEEVDVLGVGGEDEEVG